MKSVTDRDMSSEMADGAFMKSCIDETSSVEGSAGPVACDSSSTLSKPKPGWCGRRDEASAIMPISESAKNWGGCSESTPWE